MNTRTIMVMGKKEVVTITDDIDGREGAQTVTFSYAGRNYEIDLGKKNRAKLEKALEPFIAAARKAGSTGRAVAVSRPASRRPSSEGLDLRAVRAWAVDQGLEVAQRGRVAKNVLEGFRRAH
jgi:hypothetical protein